VLAVQLVQRCQPKQLVNPAHHQVEVSVEDSQVEVALVVEAVAVAVSNTKKETLEAFLKLFFKSFDSCYL
jgi:hypothetical protein